MISRCCSAGGTDPGRVSDRRIAAANSSRALPRGDLRHRNRLLCTGIGHPIILTAPGAARRCRPAMSPDRVVPVKARSGPPAGTGPPARRHLLDARPGAHFRRQLPGADQSNNVAASRSVSSNQIPHVGRSGICAGSTHLVATWSRSNTVTVAKVCFSGISGKRDSPDQVFTQPTAGQPRLRDHCGQPAWVRGHGCLAAKVAAGIRRTAATSYCRWLWRAARQLRGERGRPAHAGGRGAWGCPGHRAPCPCCRPGSTRGVHGAARSVRAEVMPSVAGQVGKE